jgi:hypothetical protein
MRSASYFICPAPVPFQKYCWIHSAIVHGKEQRPKTLVAAILEKWNEVPQKWHVNDIASGNDNENKTAKKCMKLV